MRFFVVEAGGEEQIVTFYLHKGRLEGRVGVSPDEIKDSPLVAVGRRMRVRPFGSWVMNVRSVQLVTPKLERSIHHV